MLIKSAQCRAKVLKIWMQSSLDFRTPSTPFSGVGGVYTAACGRVGCPYTHLHTHFAVMIVVCEHRRLEAGQTGQFWWVGLDIWHYSAGTLGAGSRNSSITAVYSGLFHCSRTRKTCFRRRSSSARWSAVENCPVVTYCQCRIIHAFRGKRGLLRIPRRRFSCWRRK